MLRFVQLFPTSLLSDTTPTLFFTAETTTRIDKLSGYNNSGGSVNVSVYLVRAGQSPTNATEVLAAGANSRYNAVGVIGQVMNPGDRMFLAASAANVVSAMASGVSESE